MEELKTFCEDANMQYHKLLGYAKTRWLLLLPALERVLQMFLPLKKYILAQEEKCPVLFQNFVEDPCSEKC